MNGEDFSLVQEPPVTSNIFGDFVGAAQTKFSEITEKFRTAPTSPESSVGGSIFQALYSYGAGRVDLARQQAATALLGSKTGQRFVGEVERQRMQQWMPLIIGGVIVLLVAGFAFGRR
jgi:hypothetical protein